MMPKPIPSPPQETIFPVQPPLPGAERSEPVILIRPRASTSLRLEELWQYRELLYFLVWRDLKVRYKQTLLGAAWAVIQPFCTMVVFSLFFGKLAKMPSDGVPYPLFSFAALVPWTFFANGMSLAANSLVNNQHLIRKIYFPRLVIPVGSLLSCLVDFALAFAILLGLMGYYGVWPTIHVVWLPLLLGLALISALGAGLCLSTLNVRYRDVQHVIPFLVQFWLFVTPIAYPSSLLEGPWRMIYGLNPMVGVVEGFRWALLGTQAVPGTVFLLSALAGVVMLVGGCLYFLRVEMTFADTV
jgi:lipopolysaccharide transport system permease protein